jgi:Kef-type K+ transport system membrane component KefB
MPTAGQAFRHLFFTACSIPLSAVNANAVVESVTLKGIVSSLTTCCGRAFMEETLFKVILQLTVIIVMARVFAALFRGAGQPAVFGEMAAGLVLGPSLFGKLMPHLFQRVFDPSVGEILAIFSQIGLVLLLFLIGMEFEFSHLQTHGRRAVGISLAGIVVPFGCGLLLARFIYPFVGKGISLTGFCLFTAIAISITALPTLGRILIEFGLNRSHIGVTAITAAALDDAAGWTILAAINAIVQSNFHPILAARMLIETLVFGATLPFLVRPVLKRWTRRVLAIEGEQISFTTLAIMLALVFCAAMITNLIGIFSIFGAFMMGAVLFDQEEFRRAVALRLRDFVYVFFVPIFFMYTGLRTDIGTMSVPLMWELCLLVTGVAILAKGGGCALASRFSGLSWQESASMGVLMNTRGLMELVVINVGYDLGMIPKSMFFILTLMAVATTYMTAPLLRRLMNLTTVQARLQPVPTEIELQRISGAS